MEDQSRARLSATLQRSYTDYKTSGRLPFVSPTPSKSAAPITSYSRMQSRNGNRCGTAQRLEPLNYQSLPQMPERDEPPLSPTRVQSAAPKTAAAEQQGDMEIEYVVDDAAGIPTLQFFRKQTSIPRDRMGSLGGSWRHVQQCTGLAGANLLFIDGKIKDKDIMKYPPYGIVRTTELVNQYGQRLIPRVKGGSKNVSERAREGFQYWYKEPTKNISGYKTAKWDVIPFNTASKPPGKPVRTILGGQLKVKPI